VAGRAIGALITRAPFLWPLLRAPVRRYFSAMADDWQRIAAGPGHLAPLAAAALRVDPAPERVLDLGCGTGDGTFFLAREFPRARVRGVDVSAEMIRVAVSRAGLDPEGRVAFKVGDGAAIPHPDDSFDLVALLNMPPFFAEVARVLRPGGFVVVAASIGDRTPFYTPHAALERGFRRHGIAAQESGEAGDGTFFVARAQAQSPTG
jgi:SAM-dependent methyltransferase